MKKTIDPYSVRRFATIKTRFYAKISMPDGEEGCMLWMGYVDPRDGYGRFTFHDSNKRQICVKPHRFAYQMFNGNIPEGMVIRHICDNRICVRPEHLLIGTQADNMRDAALRHRMPSGSNHYETYINEDIARAILLDLHTSRRPNKSALAREYGVGRTVVRNLADDTTWVEIDRTPYKSILSRV